MKLKFDIKNKKADLEADVEKLVEKGMDQHDKSWKDKFNTKHIAKKEMLEIKHNQKLNWFEKIQENKRKQEEFKIQEKIRIEKENRKKIKQKSIISTIIGIIALILIVIGFSAKEVNGFALGGIFLIWVLMFIWFDNGDKNNKK